MDMKICQKFLSERLIKTPIFEVLKRTIVFGKIFGRHDARIIEIGDIIARLGDKKESPEAEILL